MIARAAATSFVALLFSLSNLTAPAHAELWLDPEPALTWQDMLACPLAVVAKYESHKDNELVLRVVDVLKGKPDPAQPLIVKLEHLYSIETRKTGWEALGDRKAEDDGIPRLCYKTQIVNPGDLVPMPVRSDARQPAIYFFRDATRPVLRVSGQVQSPHFQKDWQQALDGKPMDLLFRLTQQVSSDLAREALEELGKSRDPQCLDQLFECVLNRLPDADLRGFDPTPLLVRLGDQGGDIYGRAAKLITSAAPGQNEYRFGSLALIMAITDPDQAWLDLSRLAKESDAVAVKKGVLSGIGRIARRDAAQLALESLREPDLAQTAYYAVLGLLQGESHYRYPRFPGFATHSDQKWLRDEFAKAGGDERVPERTRKDIGTVLAYLPGRHIQADLPALRTLLLNKDSAIYRGQIERESENVLRQATEACDPAVIPIVVEALHSVPGAAGNHSYSLAELAFHYATICPRALRRELEARDIPARLAAASRFEQNHKIRETMEAVGIWMPDHRTLAQGEIEQCFELAKEVRNGKPEQLETLFIVTDKLFTKQQGYTAIGALLECDSPVAKQRFLAYIDKAKEGRVGRLTGERYYGQLTSILYTLHPSHRDMHREIVVELLQSKSLSMRKAGAESLLSAWQCDFDFDPVDLEAGRTRRLAEIEPVLAQIASASEQQARVILLARAGVAVVGEPNESWLPALVEAVGQPGNAAPHALRLVETIVGEERARKFAHFPPEQRKRALRAYLQDMGKLANQSQP